jgi:hypothetical protein
METRIPIITPVLMLLRSRKGIVMITNIIVSAIVLAVPQLETVRVELTALLTTIAVALIASIAWEDAAAIGRENAAAPDEPIDADTRKLIEEIVKEVFAKQPSEPAAG